MKKTILGVIITLVAVTAIGILVKERWLSQHGLEDKKEIAFHYLMKKNKEILKNIGMVFQGFDLLPILNVRENIILPIKLNHSKVDESYFDEIIKILGIESKLNNRINELSGGQQQRVAIARALITKPKLICADEPTGNLDRTNTIEVMELFKRINKEMNTTILMITHDDKVAEYANDIIIIDDGRILR